MTSKPNYGRHRLHRHGLVPWHWYSNDLTYPFYQVFAEAWSELRCFGADRSKGDGVTTMTKRHFGVSARGGSPRLGGLATADNGVDWSRPLQRSIRTTGRMTTDAGSC